MRFLDRISVDPGVMLGQPVIKGTRLPVCMIIQALAAGDSIDELLEAYPHLDREDIFAALAYAAEMVRERHVDLAVDS